MLENKTVWSLVKFSPFSGCFLTLLFSWQPNFHCLCDAGWTTTPNGIACTEDKDECSLHPSPCAEQVQCFNTPGSFYCGACPTGTFLGTRARPWIPHRQGTRINFPLLMMDKKIILGECLNITARASPWWGWEIRHMPYKSVLSSSGDLMPLLLREEACYSNLGVRVLTSYFGAQPDIEFVGSDLALLWLSTD